MIAQSQKLHLVHNPMYRNLLTYQVLLKRCKIINSLISPTKIIKKNIILQEKLNNIKRQLKRKRSIIQYLRKQKNKKITKNINIQQFFNQSQFP